MSRVPGSTDGIGRPRTCKIAFSSEGRTLDSKLSRSLARAPYLLIAEGSPDNLTVLDNPGREAGSEGGERAARVLVEHKVDVVVTSNIGPKAARVLEDAHVTVHAGCHGTVSGAIEKCLSGKLMETHGASYSGCLETPGTSKAEQ